MVKAANDDDYDEQPLLLMTGYDDCIVGVVSRYGQPEIVCYDLCKVLARLHADGMDPDEAREFFDFNQLGAWVGDRTPCFLEPMDAAAVHERADAEAS